MRYTYIDISDIGTFYNILLFNVCVLTDCKIFNNNPNVYRKRNTHTHTDIFIYVYI